MRGLRAGSGLTALSRLVLVGLIGSGAAACSSDALRFSEPFSNPFSSGPEPATTGSLPDTGRAPRAPRAGAVQSQALPPPAAMASVPAPQAASAPLAVQPATISQPAPVIRAAAPTASGPGGWTAQGGTTITVGPSDNLNQIATRFGVPASAILSTNGLSGAGQITPGRQVVIPVYDASGAAPTRAAPVAQAPVRAPAPVAAAPKPEPVKPVAEASKRHPRPGQAESPVAERVAKTESKPAAKPEPKVAKVEPKAAPAPKEAPRPVKVEATRKLKPEVQKVAKVEPKPEPKAESKPKPEPKPVVKVEPKVETQKVAKLEPKPVPKIAPAPAKAEPAPAPAPVAEMKPEPAKPEPAKATFRWPAHGRVINGYGSSGNEGINIAVPEGTAVKAAEDGTVAYAGSDVKGYGKLVLVRHTNGFVSAYAHNGEIDVKPGEKVRRGQTIAKSGQSGNVTSPQLHFEIRSGATPVDPMSHLASN